MAKRTCRDLLDAGEKAAEELDDAEIVEVYLAIAQRVEEVAKLHVVAIRADWPLIEGQRLCNACRTPWPCDTVRLLDGE